MRLQGKRVLMVGASSPESMGAQVARRFVRAGAKIVLGGIDMAAMAQLGEELAAPTVELSITDEASLARGVAMAVEKLGGIDVAINFAGVNRACLIADETFEGLMQPATRHLAGTTPFIRDAAAARTGPGPTTTHSSFTAGRTGCRAHPPAGSPPGADKIVRIAAVEYGDRGIRVNSLAPGLTHTSMTGAYFSDPATVAGFTREVPLGRLTEVDDIANAAVWVASDECFQTGDMIRVSGGAHLRRLPTPRDFTL